MGCGLFKVKLLEIIVVWLCCVLLKMYYEDVCLDYFVIWVIMRFYIVFKVGF